MTTTRITDEMLTAAAGRGPAQSLETVNRVRRLLATVGIVDVELHPLEIAEAIAYREKERVARHAAERYLKLGPLPEHTCFVDAETQVVREHRDCLFGCRPNQRRVEVS